MSYINEEYYSQFTIFTTNVSIHRDRIDDIIKETKVGASFSSQYEVYNFMSKPVVIATGDGLRYLIQPQVPSNGFGHNLYVIKKTAYNGMKAEPFTDGTADAGNPDTAEIINQYKDENPFDCGGLNLMHKYTGLNRRAQVIYEITPADLKGAPLVYLRNIDMVVSVNQRDFNKQWFHPNSYRAQFARTEHFNQLDIDPDMKFSLTIEIVNNSRIKLPRYINMAGCVYQVPERQDLNRNDGIYISYNNLVAGEFIPSVQENEINFYRFGDDKCPCKFYHSVKEAKECGTPEAIMKQEQAKREEELLKLKHETSMKQLDQKDRVEWTKYAVAITPIVIAAIGAMFQYMLKQK